MVGAELPLTVERHIVATFAWSDDVRTRHGDLRTGYFRPEGDELFLVGPLHPEPTVDPDDFDERVSPDEARRSSALGWSSALLPATRSRAGGRACTT